jgi:tetratricopeptide (TPR) repeat protein
MKIAITLLFLCSFLFADENAIVKRPKMDKSLTTYQYYYENGYYNEAIQYIKDAIHKPAEISDSSLLKYMAYCYCASGRNDSAKQVFKVLLSVDSVFRLDSITTPPKILNVFNDAYKERFDSLAVLKAELGNKRVINQLYALNSSTVRIADDSGKCVHLKHAKHSYILSVAPLGVSQFVDARPVSGSIYAFFQVTGALGAYWAYNKREDTYSKQFGWYNGNRRKYERYQTISYVAFSVCVSSYTLSLIDNIVHVYKYRKQPELIK